MRARIVIGANYGDEGKGTVTATYAKRSGNVLNVLTNGGAQRGHSILTPDGSVTFQHFGSGTLHGADTFLSRFFILNPMQFVKEYDTLLVKPRWVFRDRLCRWSTPYDAMANLIEEQLRKRHCSCGMGIWNTVRRYQETATLLFDDFVGNPAAALSHLANVKEYYERRLSIPADWRDIWHAPGIVTHFLEDCQRMAELTTVCELTSLVYDDLIFENGQGLLLCDSGRDTADTTPSRTGIHDALELLRPMTGIDQITAHYVTRPYLTRHGDGRLEGEKRREHIAASIREDRTNHYNDNQGEFRFGELDIQQLYSRVSADAGDIPFELEVTHCDEMDRVQEFKRAFANVNIYESPLV